MTETSIARFTPGPWTTGGIFDPNGPDPRMNVWGPKPKGAQSGQIIAHDIKVADASLIAAAPDLLAAGKALLEWYERADTTQDDVASVIVQLGDAVAKAEGQS